ncbi:MAG: tRNA (adenosine(37)-N6)-threonylcarbamoyltransferase complex transferase subunit TsaD, partial [Rhodospirillaceae bacterium]|nr:tRNA (adenosine(37)-N6)-threonylcarbamoyltransferase complex transferase subunit TsaD [Rhodospirillaceae bacterium]
MNGDDLILGIESSCDDTAVALVDEAGTVLASEVVSQTEIHEQWG